MGARLAAWFHRKGWSDLIIGLPYLWLLIFFLLPFSYFMVLYSWPWFVEAWQINEISANAGGLVRWPVKLLLPLGFGLLILQGLSEIIKRVAALRGDIALDTHYERPLQ